MQYAKTITRYGAVHATEQGQTFTNPCAVKRTHQKFAPEGAELTCKVCIAWVAEMVDGATEGVDGNVVIGYPDEQSADGAPEDDMAVDEATMTETGQEQAAAPAAEEPKKVKRARAPRAVAVADGVKVVDQVPVADVILDSDVQPREHISTQTISEYAEAMKAGAEFPAIVVFRGEDGKTYAADGWHRVTAARQAEKPTILAEIRTGTKRDAILYSVSVNATHGLRRTDADKRRAVMRLLTDPEWKKWSANAIAEKVGVSQPFVSGIRAKLEGEENPTTVQTADGRVINTQNIGRPSRQRTEAPAAPETNGHAAVPPATVIDDTEDPLAGIGPVMGDGSIGAAPAEAPEPEEEIDPVAAFARQMVEVFTGMGRFDPEAVWATLGQDELKSLGDQWGPFIDTLDKYSEALEKALD